MPDRNSDQRTDVNLTDDEPSGGWRWPTRDQDHGKKRSKRGTYDNGSTALQRTLDGLRRL